MLILVCNKINRTYFITCSHGNLRIPNSEMFTWFLIFVCDLLSQRITTGKNQTPQHAPFCSVTKAALAFGLPTWWLPVPLDVLQFCPLFAHCSAFQYAQIVIPLTIRSFIKELHSDQGNKGDGGDHSGLWSLHGTETGSPQKRSTGPLELGTKVLLTRSLLCWM